MLSLMAGCGEKTPEETTAPKENSSAVQTSAMEETTAPPESSSSAAGANIKLSVPEGGTWTVLVYLCGTDLESNGGYASINVAEMCLAQQSQNVNVILETGGTKQWSIDGIDPSARQRWQVVPDDIQLVESLPLANMGEAGTLGDFLRWGVETYPADKYMCLLWDHGGGSVAGIAVDELHEGDMLNLKELAQGVSMAGVQFEL